MRKKTTLLISVILLGASILYGQSSKAITEYLKVPSPIILNKTNFYLAWTSHPSPNYYKQEYITAKDKIEQYKQMITLELLISNSTPADLAKAKLDELKQLKGTNPLINYESFQKNGEIIIDFLISENSADGNKVNIIERNVYRYKAFVGKNGQNGVMLLGASERAYSNEVDQFLVALKTNKSKLLNAVAALILPKIAID